MSELDELIAQIGFKMKTLQKEKDSAEQRALEYSDMVDIKNKKIRELTQKVVTLETKIKMLERG